MPNKRNDTPLIGFRPIVEPFEFYGVRTQPCTTKWRMCALMYIYVCPFNSNVRLIEKSIWNTNTQPIDISSMMIVKNRLNILPISLFRHIDMSDTHQLIPDDYVDCC